MTTADLQTLNIDTLKPLFGPADESHLPNATVRLSENRRHVARQSKRLLRVLNKTRACTDTIGKLPASDESLHCVLNGEYALFDFVPSVLALSGQPISDLWIVTLGFSKANIAALDTLVDAGQVQRISVLCSNYFAAQDKPIHAQAVELCQKHGFRMAALRNHAKLLLIATGDHRLVCESSANLRSCHNVETASLFNDAGLYEFHRTWVDEMLSKGGAP